MTNKIFRMQKWNVWIGILGILVVLGGYAASQYLAPSEGLHWKTYGNTTFGFTYEAPEEWNITEDTSATDLDPLRGYMAFSNEANNAPDLDASARKFSVAVYENKEGIPSYTYQGNPIQVKIIEQEVTAYVFSREGCDATKELGCGSFIIPFEANTYWFLLTGSSLEDPRYQHIVSSFKVTSR